MNADTHEEDRQQHLANQESTRQLLRLQRVPYPSHVTFAQIVDRASRAGNLSRDEVYRKLLNALERGFFGPALRFANMKHPALEGTEYALQNLTKELLVELDRCHGPEIVRDQYLAHCWIEAATANRWLEAEGVKSRFVTEDDFQAGKVLDGSSNDGAPAAPIRPADYIPNPHRPAAPGNSDEWKSVFVAEALEEVGYQRLSGLPNNAERHRTIEAIVKRKQEERNQYVDGVSERPALDAWREWRRAIQEPGGRKA
jgi:hypothetical protein